MKKVCKICGRIFDDETKSQICSTECRHRAKIISQQKYYLKNQNEIRAKQNAERRAKNVTDKTKANNVVCKATETIDTSKDIVIETLEKSILDNLDLLDEIRNEILKVLNELKAKQSAYEQKDFSILHAFEGTESDAKLLELAKQCKQNRKGRRDYKNYIIFLNGIVKGLPQNAKQAFLDAKKAQEYRNTFYSIKY